MGATKMLKAIIMLLALGIVPAPGIAQTPSDAGEKEPLQQVAQQHEEQSTGYLWVWGLTVSVWFSSQSDPMHEVRVPPKDASQKRNLSIRICKNVQRVVVTGTLPTFGMPAELARRLKATLAAEHGAKDIYLPTEPIAGATDIVRVYQGHTGISYDMPLLDRVPTKGPTGLPMLPPPLPINVWRCETECRRQRDVSPVGEETLFMAVLSMENPFKLFGCEWKITSVTQDTVTFSCVAPTGWGTTVHQVMLDRRSARLRRYDILSSGQGARAVSWRIHSYSPRSGLVVPTYVTRKVVQRENGRWKHILYQFSLKSLSKTAACDFHLPIGNVVMDYRLSAGAAFDNYGTPDILKHVVQYRWDGSLPSDVELKRTAYQQGKLPSAGKGLRATWALLVPGMLLLAVALFLYRRMRQSV